MSFWGDSFTYNGISTATKGLMVYDIGGNESSDEEYAGTVTVVDEVVGKRWRPYFYGAKFEKKQVIRIVFGADLQRVDAGTNLTRQEMDDIATWLIGYDEYKPLQIGQTDMSTITYKCIVTSLTPITFGHMPWAFEAIFECDSPYGYLAPESNEYVIDGSETIAFVNKSSLNAYYYPKIIFEPAGGDSLSIVNTSDGGREFTLSEIPAAVTEIEIDNDTCIITNDQGVNLYDGCNYKFVRLKPGTNNLTVTGDGILTIVCEFPVNAGG